VDDSVKLFLDTAKFHVPLLHGHSNAFSAYSNWSISVCTNQKLLRLC